MGRDDRRDPIQWAAENGRDLYDVATWESRSRLDGFAVSLYGAILAGGRALVITVAFLIVAGQAVITGIVTLQDPLVGLYILLSIVPALLLAAALWRSDVVVREPIDKLAITFLLGFLFAGFAAPLNSAFQSAFFALGGFGAVLFFFLIVGPVEETVKLLAVRLHAYRSAEFDAVIDGAIYGAMAGLGFAAIENTLYITQNYVQMTGAGAAQLGSSTFQTAAIRTFAGPGHVIYSAFAGYYLGLAKFNPRNRGPIVVKGLVIAAVIHATYNVLVSNLGLVTSFVPVLSGLPPTLAFIGFVIAFDGFFFTILYAKLRRYKQVFHDVGAESFYEEGPAVSGTEPDAVEEPPAEDATAADVEIPLEEQDAEAASMAESGDHGDADTEEEVAETEEGGAPSSSEGDDETEESGAPSSSEGEDETESAGADDQNGHDER